MQIDWRAPTLLGVLVGVGLSTYARSGNGFQVGPGMLAFLVLLVAVAIVGASLIATRYNRVLGGKILAFAAIAFVVLILLSVVWPYPASDGPVPLEP